MCLAYSEETGAYAEVRGLMLVLRLNRWSSLLFFHRGHPYPVFSSERLCGSRSRFTHCYVVL